MPLGGAVQWSMPRAGFFPTLQLPFAFDGEACLRCVRDHGVITTPLSFFSLDHRDDQPLHLALSNLPMEQIDPGVQRLAAYVESRLQQAS